MKKIIICSLIAVSLLLSFSFMPAFATNEISVYINGEKLLFDVSPVNIDGRILVPFRVISEYMGAHVEWDSSTQSVMITSTPSYPSNHSDSVHYNFTTAKYPLYLYSNDGKTFLGKLVTNKYDDESFSNSYGDYGSKYSRTSIFNEYSDYGSKYDDESAFNKYASKPPIIVDSNGKFIAYLTANEYTVDGVTYLELLSILREQHQ